MGRPSPRAWPALLAAVGLAFAAVSWRTRTDAPTAALNEQPPLETAGETKQDLAKLAAAAETRPHVVFVMLDDVGFNDVGYASSDLGAMTPFLDGLMADGVRVDRLYGQQVCTPSRAAMLTGKLPIHLELQHWQVAPSEPWGLPTREATMAQYLKALGYSTHMVGKWHLGHYNNASTPLNRGFDSFYGFYSGGVDYLTHVSQEACLNRTDFDDDDFRRTDHATRSPDDDALDEEGRSAHVYVKDPSTGYVWRCYRDLWDNERPVTDAHGQHQTSLMNERAIAVLERHAVVKNSEPIFAYVSYPNAHLPLGHYKRSNILLIDAGWTGLSAQGKECGYGAIPKHPELAIVTLKQECGEITPRDGSPLNFESYPIGTILEVAPHHSCAATHQHAECHVVRDEFSGLILDSWPICKGW